MKKVSRTIILGTRIGYADVNLEKAKTFTLNQKNRNIVPNHLSRIKREMRECLWTMMPIVVNIVTGNILDGQHRHKSYVDLMEAGELPNDYLLGVMYVSVPEEFELEAIERINNNDKSWAIGDFVKRHSDDESYNKLIEFCLSHSLTCDKDGAKIRYGSAMVKGKSCTQILKNGEFSATNEEFERAEKVHDEMIQIIESLGKEKRGSYMESLATTWIRFRERYDFATWMKEFNSTNKYSKMPSNNGRQWDALFAIAHSNIEMKKK
jgi:hypothetical protein